MICGDIWRSGARVSRPDNFDPRVIALAGSGFWVDLGGDFEGVGCKFTFRVI